MRRTFDIRTECRLQVVDVTDEVEAALPRGYDGVCTVFSTHTTTGVCINEAESRPLGDIESMLTEVTPDDDWDHDGLDGNANLHPRMLLVGNGVSTPVVDDALDLGRWQSVLLMECDDPRTRTAMVATPWIDSGRSLADSRIPDTSPTAGGGLIYSGMVARV